MQKYSEYAPTPFDRKGIVLDDQQDWIVVYGQNRDSGALQRSNFAVVLADFGGESDTVEVHRFGHWACGWLEIIIVHPSLADKAEGWERALENYPVANDEHFSQVESEEADQVWANCYDSRERIEYIRENRNQFEFHNFADLMQCVRGEYFAGYAGDLIA